MLPYKANDDVYDTIVDIHSALCTDDPSIPELSGKIRSGKTGDMIHQAKEATTVAMKGTNTSSKNITHRRGVTIEEVPDESLMGGHVTNDDDIADDNFILIDRQPRETPVSRSSVHGPTKN